MSSMLKFKVKTAKTTSVGEMRHLYTSYMLAILNQEQQWIVACRHAIRLGL
jgi:hypothetical protein